MTQQLELTCSPPRYPHAPAARATDTSLAAARAIGAISLNLREMCLCSFKVFGPGTADEVAKLIGTTILACRPRMAELNRLGKIADSGLRRPNASGKRAIVWKAL